MSVLDDQHQAPVLGLGEAIEQRQRLLKEAGVRHAGVGVHIGAAQGGQQPGELPGPAHGEQGGDPVGAHIVDQLTQRRRERAVRDSAEFHAAAGEHAGAFADTGGELLHQPGLADPCLAADQHGRRSSAERVVQGGELIPPAH